MAKTVTYSVVPRKNPSKPDVEPLYYAQAQASGDVTIREMADRIEKSCTVTRADVVAVLVALEDVIVDALKAGEIVRLADIGMLQVGLSSKGANSEERFDASLIRKARINFRPGAALSGMLTALTYTKVEKRDAKKPGTPTEPEVPAE